jgi:hypothetical protein
MKLINWLGRCAFITGVIATLGHRFEFLSFKLSLYSFLVAVIVCTLFILAGLYKLLVSTYKKQPFHLELVPLMIACALLPVLAFKAVGPDVFSAAMIHDITTDTDNPPVFIYIQPDDGYRVNSLVYAGAEVSAKQRLSYPDIKTFMTTVSPRAVYQEALFTGNLLGWEIIGKDPLSLRFEAVTKTPLFGFVDDVAVRVTPLVDGGSAVDLRSMSRVGMSDLGANAKRIRKFIGELEVHLEAR